MVAYGQSPRTGCGGGRRPGSRRDGFLVTLSFCIAMSGAAGCGSADDRSASSLTEEQERTSQTATPGPVARSPLDQELSPSAVESLGLRRQDAVTVLAPVQIAAGESPVRLSVTI